MPCAHSRSFTTAKFLNALISPKQSRAGIAVIKKISLIDQSKTLIAPSTNGPIIEPIGPTARAQPSPVERAWVG